MNGMSNTMLLGASVVLMALSAVADYVRKDELSVASEKAVGSDAAEPSDYRDVDLRNRWPVETLGEIELPYSAVGWDEANPLPAGATVRLNLQAGAFFGGKFAPGTFSSYLATGLTGRGTYGWLPSGVEGKVYRILHETTRGGHVVEDETLCAYFDFSEVEMVVSPAKLRGAVLGVSQPVVVTEDARRPWSRIGGDGDGLRNAANGATLSFSFKGRGVLRCDYDLQDGELAVVADNGVVTVFAEPTAGWVPYQVAFDGDGTHTVTFAYTAVGGKNVAIRNVRWEMPDKESRTAGSGGTVRVDLQDGEVRTPKKFAHVLPFVYSPTNFTGTIDGTSSRVSVVQLEGTDPDVTKWSEVSGTTHKLKEATDEGEVKWMAKKGVWKVTFEIFDGSTLKDTQIKFFDLRKAKGSGFALILT